MKAESKGSVNVLDFKGKKAEVYKLDNKVFDGVVNKKIIYYIVKAYEANQRKGTASTKTRGEVRGGGSKPWRQKGTGRARIGSSRSPIWKHGGVVFGPKPRDYSLNLPKKVKTVALAAVFNDKFSRDEVVVVNEFPQMKGKTKEVADFLKVFNLTDKTNLLIDIDPSVEFKRAARNLHATRLLRAQDVNAYHLLRHNTIVITKASLDLLTDKIKHKVKQGV